MLSEAAALRTLKRKQVRLPQLLVVLGTGWNGIRDQIEIEKEVSYKELFGVRTKVPGHEGLLAVGRVARSTWPVANSRSQRAESRRVALMVGRLHLYEGYTAQEATLPYRVLAKAGVKTMIVTSAVGALNPKYRVGDIVILKDMLTVALKVSPLKGKEFVDLSEAFDRSLRRVARGALRTKRVRFHEGIYAYYPGPQFETPADKRAFKKLGGDVIGMSTVPEVITAKGLGIRVLGLSFVTNLAFVKHSHDMVLAAAKKGERTMIRGLKSILAAINN